MDELPKTQYRVDHLHWGSLADWAQLVRLPNVFTVIADTLAATLLVGIAMPTVLVFSLVATVLAYWAGMILNDVADLEEDIQFRPTRPLASGRISPVIAGHVAKGFLLTVPIIVLFATQAFKADSMWMGAAFVSSVALVTAILFYNSYLKSTIFGPILMGSCRSLNILMVGMAQYSVSPTRPGIELLLWFAAAIGLYIMGVTIYARREERESGQAGLILGLGLEIIGMLFVAMLPILSSDERVWRINPSPAYPVLIGLIALTVVNRGAAGALHPVSRKVQLAVKHAILTLILLDASVAALCGGPWIGAGVALLLVPAITAGQWFRST